MTVYVNNKLSISSNLSNLKFVEDFIDFIFSEYKINKKYLFPIKLSVNEAVTNCIIHGGNETSENLVEIQYEYTISEIVFSISDNGKGFDLDSVKNPLEIENIKIESGRGIFLMTKYSSKIEFLKNGSNVKLFFSL